MRAGFLAFAILNLILAVAQEAQELATELLEVEEGETREGEARLRHLDALSSAARVLRVSFIFIHRYTALRPPQKVPKVSVKLFFPRIEV